MDEAHDGKGAAACPSSPAPRQPRHLLAHPSEMALIVRPGLGLDRDGDAGGRDRHRVDVSLAVPRQRMAQPPALCLERGERALHLVLRAGADSTAPSERKPVPSVETQPCGCEEQQPGERRRSRARHHKPEQRGDDASEARFAGVREPAILLATRVVHAPTASSSQPPPNALSLSIGSATSRSSHRCQTVPGASVWDRAMTLRLPALGEIGPRLDRAASRFCGDLKDFCEYRYRDSNCVAHPVTPVFIGVFGFVSPAGGGWGQPGTGHAAPKMPLVLPPVSGRYFEPPRNPGGSTPGATLRPALDRVARPFHLHAEHQDLQLQSRASPTLAGGCPAMADRGERIDSGLVHPLGARGGGLTPVRLPPPVLLPA